MRLDIHDLPETYEQAIAIGKAHYFPKYACVNGHISPRTVVRKRCMKCASEYMRKKYATKAEYSSYSKNYQKHKRATDPAYAKASSDRRMAKYRNDSVFREAYKANLNEKYRIDLKYQERRKEICRAYAARNPDKLAEQNQIRRAASRKARPKWLTEEMKNEMRATYAEARRLSEVTGMPHEVDHIAPLNGKLACGLHVPWNLQVLPRFENRSKHNKFAGAPFAFIEIAAEMA